MRAVMRFMFLLLTICCITSCGFHLRGTEHLDPRLTSLYLKTKDPYGQLTHNIEDYFKVAGIDFVSSPLLANYILEILSETESQELISVSGTQQTRQYNLFLTVTFQLTKPDGTVILPRQSLSETRVFTMQANQILGGSNETVLMYQQMRRDIVYDILSRIGSIDVKDLLKEGK